MTRLMLGLLLVVGCARSRAPAPAPGSEAPPDSQRIVAERDVGCERQASVTVHVQNTGSADVEISFGPYTPARAAPGFSRTTYKVSRSYLTGNIRLRIARGGLQVGGPATIPTEYVVCNDATLIIGAQPRDSYFYGDLVGGGS